MSEIDAAILAKLKATSAITALVGQRIYPDELPLNCILPALTVSLISDIPDNDVPDASKARVQISCWSNPPESNGTRSPAGVMEIKKAIKAVFHWPRLNGISEVWTAGSTSYSVSTSQVQQAPRMIEDLSGYRHVPVDVLVEFRE